MKLTSGQKFIAVIVGMVLVAALIVFLLILPRATAVGELREDVKQAESDVESARSLLAQRQAIKARSAETETTLLRLANQLPENPELPTFIIELQDIVNESGLVFAEIVPDEPTVNPEGFDEIGLQLTVRGEWTDVVDVLQRLRRIVRQVRIVGFQIDTYTPDAPASGAEIEGLEQETLVEAILEIEVYTLGTAQPAVEAAPAPTGSE
ncbi:MAG: type 4a pilus biogenesis protein PilO [Coriobacteriia bacterium]|nr:type 4a pilus biogenesis protein PilO [Coriobacteriia bacterium]